MTWLNLLKRKLNTVSQFSPAERSGLLQAFLLLPLVAVAVRLVGLQMTQRWLMRLPQVTLLEIAEPDLTETQVWATVRMVQVAVRYESPWVNCLTRSLVLCTMLHRQRIASDLRIGVQREEGIFRAHAWVEYQNQVLNDQSDVSLRFTPFQHSFEVKA